MLIIIVTIIAGLIIVGAIYTKPASIYKNTPSERNLLEGKKVVFVYNSSDPLDADGVRGHLEVTGEAFYIESFYERYMKRFFDVILSFLGLLLLSPLFLLLAIIVYVDDPGPVLFTQRRVGKNKQFFAMHKFRSMKITTPRDVPTHMLKNPGQYTTRVGRFLRDTSLDELPQLWDILLGNMSIVGPRPALWNQDYLTAERDKWGANDVTPGLTGWAQINGRDEIEIEDKARHDGEYCRNLSFKMDIKCFFLTVKYLLSAKDSTNENVNGTISSHNDDDKGTGK